MSRMAVIFDPGVEGLAAMAAAVAAGARDKGAQVELLDAGRMDAAALSASIGAGPISANTAASYASPARRAKSYAARISVF